MTTRKEVPAEEFGRMFEEHKTNEFRYFIKLGIYTGIIITVILFVIIYFIYSRSAFDSLKISASIGAVITAITTIYLCLTSTPQIIKEIRQARGVGED